MLESPSILYETVFVFVSSTYNIIGIENTITDFDIATKTFDLTQAVIDSSRQFHQHFTYEKTSFQQLISSYMPKRHLYVKC